MSVNHTQLEIYKDVDAGTFDATQFVIPVVGPFRITFIEAQAAFDMNSAVKVAFGGTVIWFTKGSFEMKRHREFIGDGIKKVELILDATDLVSGSVWLGGFVAIEQVV